MAVAKSIKMYLTIFVATTCIYMVLYQYHIARQPMSTVDVLKNSAVSAVSAKLTAKNGKSSAPATATASTAPSGLLEGRYNLFVWPPLSLLAAIMPTNGTANNTNSTSASTGTRTAATAASTNTTTTTTTTLIPTRSGNVAKSKILSLSASASASTSLPSLATTTKTSISSSAPLPFNISSTSHNKHSNNNSNNNDKNNQHNQKNFNPQIVPPNSNDSVNTHYDNNYSNNYNNYSNTEISLNNAIIPTKTTTTTTATANNATTIANAASNSFKNSSLNKYPTTTIILNTNTTTTTAAANTTIAKILKVRSTTNTGIRLKFVAALEPPPLYIITPTYRRPEQLAELTRLGYTLKHIVNLLWLVIEDAKNTSALVTQTLNRIGVPYEYLVAPMPEEYKQGKKAKPRGVSNRNRGLLWLRQNASEGVFYFADDDNTYDINIFEQMRYTKKVSMWPVGLVTKTGVSTPIIRNGKIDGFYDGWIGGRKFPVDMAGFAVSVKFLHERPLAKMPYKPGYEEDGFLKSLAPLNTTDIELLASDCTEILTWHTQTKKNQPALALNMTIYNNTNLLYIDKQQVRP